MDASRTLAFAGVVSCALLGLLPARASGTPLDFLPVTDPLEDELRALEVSGVGPLLPHLSMRPLQILELPRLPLADSLPQAARVSVVRLSRALARDLPATGPVRGTTPRVFQWTTPEGQRVDFSTALEGSGHFVHGDESRLGSRSGLRFRLATQSNGWLAYTHLIAGYVEGSQRFAQPITTRMDAILYSEEAYLAYTAARWTAQAGRSHWHWGPGHEGSLLLSKTSAPLTGLALRLRIESLRADGIILSATLAHLAREQYAAHRLEWEPRAGLRIGISEAVRYQASFWQPLYMIGVLPYALVQNLLVQDEVDTTGALRNNVMGGLDVAWRVARGTRVYFELLIDDLSGEGSTAVNKIGYQLGLDGVGTVRGSRVTWGSEYTRLSRFVYTSFFGRSFVAQERPLGFPTGPDARRIRVHAAWDPSPDWQVFGAVARTDLGENGLHVPFIPGPRVDTWAFGGTVQETREVDVGLRYWPASGIDVSLSGGYRWVENQGHVADWNLRGTRGSVVVRLVR